MYVRINNPEGLRVLDAAGRLLETREQSAICPRPSAYFDSLFLDFNGSLGTTCYGYIKGGLYFKNFAGSEEGAVGSSGDGGPALRARFGILGRVVALPNSNFLVADNNSFIRKIATTNSAFFLTSTSYFVPEENTEIGHEFNQQGKHLRTRSTLTGAVEATFGYDSVGRIITITDGDNRITTIARDAAGSPLSITAPHGQVTQLTLDANGYLSGIKNPNNEAWALQMSPAGLLTQSIDPRGGVHAYQYDLSGRLTRAEAPGGFAYALVKSDINGGRSVAMTSPAGRTRNFSVALNSSSVDTRTATSASGLVSTEARSPAEVRTVTTPDGMAYSTTRTPDPRYAMSAPLQTVETTTPSGLKHRTAEARTATLATPGNPFSISAEVSTTSENAPTCNTGATCTQQVATTTYNRATNTRTTTSAAGRTTTELLDARDRVIQSIVAGTAPVSMSYDNEGRIAQITQAGRTTTMSYDAQGMLAQMVDPLGRSVQYTRDAVGRVTSTQLPGGRIVTTAFDAMGNPTATAPPGQPSHQQTYTPRNQLASYAPPALANVSSTSNYSYNGDRQLTSAGEPDGAINYAYGAASALLGTVTADVSRAYTYDAAERLQGVTTSDGIGLSFTYDGKLRTSATWSGIGPSPLALGYAFNNHMQTSATTVAGQAATWTYDADELLTLASGLGTNVQYARDAGNGRITAVTTGVLTQAWGYDANYGELASQVATYNAAPLYSISFVRDLLGRVTTKTENLSGAITTTAYVYDAAGRVVSEDRSGVVTTWGFDANGNRVQRNGLAVGTADTQDRLLTYASASYTYSAGGRRLTQTIGAATTAYSWDNYGQLRNVVRPGGAAVISYLYDGEGRRVGKQVGGNLAKGWLYDGQLRIVGETDAAGAVVSRFVYGSRSNVPDTMVRGGVTYRYLVDQVGSVRAVVDVATGTVVQAVAYNAWGEVLSDSAPGFQPFGYAGGLTDGDTGLVHFGAREYDPRTGTWISKDPIRLDGGLNVYGYVEGDPANEIDPSGLLPGWFCKQFPWFPGCADSAPPPAPPSPPAPPTPPADRGECSRKNFACRDACDARFKGLDYAACAERCTEDLDCCMGQKEKCKKKDPGPPIACR
jgi:RHS repeat-associated protein